VSYDYIYTQNTLNGLFYPGRTRSANYRGHEIYFLKLTLLPLVYIKNTRTYIPGI